MAKGGRRGKREVSYSRAIWEAGQCSSVARVQAMRSHSSLNPTTHSQSAVQCLWMWPLGSSCILVMCPWAGVHQLLAPTHTHTHIHTHGHYLTTELDGTQVTLRFLQFRPCYMLTLFPVLQDFWKHILKQLSWC